MLVSGKAVNVVSPAISLFAQRDTLQGGGRPGLTLCDKSFSHSQPYCLRGSPSPSVPLSLLFMLLRVFGSTPPSFTNLQPVPHPPSPPLSSTPLHLYSILRACSSLLCRPFLILLYLPPSSCSSFSETMLGGCRGTRAEATTIILLHPLQVNARRKGARGKTERLRF